jgi:hypothetical protein
MNATTTLRPPPRSVRSTLLQASEQRQHRPPAPMPPRSAEAADQHPAVYDNAPTTTQQSALYHSAPRQAAQCPSNVACSHYDAAAYGWPCWTLTCNHYA